LGKKLILDTQGVEFAGGKQLKTCADFLGGGISTQFDSIKEGKSAELK